jgi:hypothetical protein
MKRLAPIAATAAVLLLLTGCSGGTDQVNTAVDSATPAAAATEDAAAPLTAETATTNAARGDAVFLESVRSELRPDNVIPNATDEQLLEAGEKACEGIASGADTLTLSLIDGEEPDASGFYPDSGVIIRAARAALC